MPSDLNMPSSAAVAKAANYWRDKLQPAEFRKAKFSIRSADSEVGRRSVLHEFPQRDTPGGEDMGRRTRRWRIEALIVGTDYFAARDKLIDALETAGPGELVHPFYGRLWVRLDGPVRISESFDEGGMARFDLDFVEAGDDPQPTMRVDTQGKVTSAAAAARAAAGLDFESKYNVEGEPAFVGASALAMAKSAMSSMSNLRSMVPDLSSTSVLLSTATGVSAGLANLIRTPAELASNVQALIGGFTGLAENPLSAISGLQSLFSFGKKSGSVSYDADSSGASGITAVAANDIPLTTPARIQQADNQTALADLVQRSALIYATEVSAEADFDTLDAALATRDLLAEQLDDHAGLTDSDEVYATLTALRVALVRDVAARGANLSRLSTATLPSTLPAVVAAWRIYGDATRDADIIARNPAVRHPGFVPGGLALEILIDQ